MNMTRDRVQSIVWAIVIAVAAALLLALTLRVNAVKAQVRLTERRIIAAKQEKLSLETEFQTRANQQQLAAINAVEFGFKAPGEGQYVEGERQLAALSRPVAPEVLPGVSAPVRMAAAETSATSTSTRAPTRMAEADVPAAGSLPAALAPLKGQALHAGTGTRFLADRHEVAASTAERVPPDGTRTSTAGRAGPARPVQEGAHPRTASSPRAASLKAKAVKP